MPLPAGTRLDSYEIVSPVGAGGMGEVYRARDTALKRDVAIKVLPDFWSRDAERLRRFETEAQAAATLNHPNVVSIFHVGRYNGSPYIVTELLQGETLRERLRHGAMPVREVLDIARSIAQGLAAAHAAGVVHRDLKPENIFLTKDGRVKILDFGLAKFDPVASENSSTMTVQQATNPGHVLGTVGYMSPEQVRGKPADARSDIFALGVILYEMVTGRPAFRKETSAETMSAILKEDPPAISQYSSTTPPGLQRVIARCLTKNPEQRFQHASDVGFALEALSDSDTYGRPTVVGKVSARKNWLWVLATALIAATFTAAILWWRQPLPVPVVESITQLTDDSQPKGVWPLLTDGLRIYYSQGVDQSLRIGQVAVTGGPASVLPAPFPNPYALGIAPKGSALLVRSNGPELHTGPLWLLSLPSGDIRRLTGLEGGSGSITVDGRILFTQGNALLIAAGDGSQARQLVGSMNGNVGEPSMSPDGKHIAFTVDATTQPFATIYIGNADGSGVHAVMSADESAGVCCSGWSADGKYLIVPKFHGLEGELWVVPVRTSVFRTSNQPMRLTNGPLTYTDPVASPDGNQVFAIGIRRRGELMRYDLTVKEFVPFLGGISVLNATSSSDGNWVAYVAYPEGTLWRSKRDGTERLQLTYPPHQVAFTNISPDGKRISYISSGEKGVFVVDAEGGSPRKIGENPGAGDWSPDGKRLVYAEYGEADTHSKIKIFDFTTGVTAEIKSEVDRDGPVWVGPDKFVASNAGSRELVVFDLATQQWSVPISNPAWGSVAHWARSPDYKYLCYITAGQDPKAIRVRTSDNHAEVIASLKDFKFAPAFFGIQMSVAPDGSPVFTRNTGNQEVYALTVKWP